MQNKSKRLAGVKRIFGFNLSKASLVPWPPIPFLCWRWSGHLLGSWREACRFGLSQELSLELFQIISGPGLGLSRPFLRLVLVFYYPKPFLGWFWGSGSLPDHFWSAPKPFLRVVGAGSSKPCLGCFGTVLGSAKPCLGSFGVSCAPNLISDSSGLLLGGAGTWKQDQTV